MFDRLEESYSKIPKMVILLYVFYGVKSGPLLFPFSS